MTPGAELNVYIAMHLNKTEAFNVFLSHSLPTVVGNILSSSNLPTTAPLYAILVSSSKADIFYLYL